MNFGLYTDSSLYWCS